MRPIAFLILMLFATLAHAGLIARHPNGDWVRLSAEPCPATVAKLVPEDQRSMFHKALAQVHGKVYTACWTYTPGGALLVYDDGDQGMVPGADFKEEPDV